MIDFRKTRRLKYLLSKNPSDFRQIIEDTDLAVCITDENANFVAVNYHYTQLYGYGRGELVGQCFTMVVPPENRDALKKYHDQFFADKYEIMRVWVVQNRAGEYLQISADADYKIINGHPHKVTFIQFEKKINPSEMQDPNYANNALAVESLPQPPPEEGAF